MPDTPTRVKMLKTKKFSLGEEELSTLQMLETNKNGLVFKGTKKGEVTDEFELASNIRVEPRKRLVILSRLFNFGLIDVDSSESGGGRYRLNMHGQKALDFIYAAQNVVDESRRRS